MPKESETSCMTIELPSKESTLKVLNEIYDDIPGKTGLNEFVLVATGPMAIMQELYQYTPNLFRRQHYEGGPFVIGIGNLRSVYCYTSDNDKLTIYVTPKVEQSLTSNLDQDYEYYDRSRSEE